MLEALRRRRDPDLFAVLAVASVVRVAWVVVAARRPEVQGDPFAYLRHADDLAEGRGYATLFFGVPSAYYPVGYPGLLGVVLRVVRLVAPGTGAFPVAIALNVLAGVATVAVTRALATRLLGARPGRWAGWLVALHPGLVLYAATAHLETVFTLLVALLALLATGEVPGRRRLVALGVTLGAAALVRPIVLPLLVVVLVVWRRHGWRRSLGAAAVAGLAAGLVIAPWTIRNAVRMDAFVPISTNTGDNLCVGHSDAATGEYVDLGSTCWLGYDDVALERLEVERDRRGTREALDWALEHPGREASLLARKTWALLAHDHEGLLAAESYGEQRFLPGAVRTGARVVADLWWWVLLPAAAAGAVVLWRGRSVDGRVVLGLAAVVLLSPLPFFGGARFHVPAAPLLALAAAATISAAVGRGRPRPASPVPGPATRR